MLALQLATGSSVVIGDSCVVTVAMVLPHERRITLSIVRAAYRTSGLAVRTIEAAIDQTVTIGNNLELRPLTAVDNQTRIGINVPSDVSVHRLEVYEEIQRANNPSARKRPPDSDDDVAGAAVPKPSSPKPPTLDVRLSEPKDEVE